MKRLMDLLRKLTKLFRSGGTTKTGRVVVRNISKSNNMDRFTKLMKNDPKTAEAFLKLKPAEKTMHLKDITSGIHTPEETYNFIKRTAVNKTAPTVNKTAPAVNKTTTGVTKTSPKNQQDAQLKQQAIIDKHKAWLDAYEKRYGI